MISCTLPIRLVSESNVREHWATKAKRVKSQRQVTCALLRTRCGVRCPLPAPWHVTITRVAPRALDSDNLARSAKAVRDEVAAWLGSDDGINDPITWAYAQRKGKPREYACVVEIRSNK